MNDVAIRVEHLSKLYRIGGKQEKYRTLRDALADAAVAPLRRVSALLRAEKGSEAKDTIWALNDVSFEVRRGEVVGVIGRNGAGKSTLLKILSRITEPTLGRAEIFGRVGSLLEVGTGFHPELTGRENIYLNGAILGMKRAEIERRFDEIVAFAEIERFVETPVKHYSSGMYLRLAFAVAAHMEPEILLVDEVLAVGDAQFQKKCLGKMGEVAREGRTVLFVSHNLAAMEALCRYALILVDGRIDFIGDVADAITSYSSALVDHEAVSLADVTNRSGTGRVRFWEIALRGEEPPDTDERIATGKRLTLQLELRAAGGEGGRAPTALDLAITVKDARGQKLTTLANFFTGQCTNPRFHQGRLLLSCVVESLPLLEGDYSLDLWSACGSELVDLVPDALRFHVSAGSLVRTADARKPLARKHGPILIAHDWIEQPPTMVGI